MAQHYDVAVVGGGVSHLVAALMFARAGRRVVLLQPDAEPAHHPEPCYGVGDASMVSRWHDELGITQPPGLRQSVRAPLHIVLPQHRLTIGGGREALAAELKRAFTGSGAAIDDFVQRLSQCDKVLSHYLLQAPCLPAETLGQRVTLWRRGRALAPFAASAQGQGLDTLFGAIPQGHPLRRMFMAGLQLLVDHDARDATVFVAVHQMAQALLGQPAQSHDRHELTALLHDAVVRAGIEVRKGARVLRLGRSGKRASHLQLADERQELRAEYYVYGGSDTPWATAESESAAPQAAPPRPHGGWLQWRWLVPTACVNPALGPCAWLLDGRQEGRGEREADGPVVLQRRKLGDGAQMQLTMTAPWYGTNLGGTQASVDGSQADAKAAWARIEPRLRRLLPYLPKQQRGLEEALPLSRPLRALPGKSTFGLTGRTRKTAFSNVVYCGRDVVPGLGLEGEYVAAAGAVALVRQRARWP